MAVTSFLSRLVATLALVSSTTALAYGEPETETECGPAYVKVRDPPTFPNGTTPIGWTPPPSGWIFKPWNQVITSNAQTAFLRNFQWDPTPINPTDPEGTINDLSTFQLPNNDTVFTSYGVTTPNPNYIAVMDFRGTGILENATSQYSWLGWGCDGNKNPYYLTYATAAEASGTPSGIDFMSVVDTGLDEETKNAVVAALKRSKNEEIRKIADSFLSNVQDGARRDKGRITECDDKCKTNENLIGIIG